ncbi:unnamed protein product [Arctogadus glacialis]
MPRTSVHRAIHTTSAKIASLFAQTVNHPTGEELGDVLDPEDGEDSEAGAAEEEDPGREAAPPGTVSGAEEIEWQRCVTLLTMDNWSISTPVYEH